MSSVDFVFEGGGAKGMVFVGALEEFFASTGHTPGRIMGTSAGAISAAFLAAGYQPQEMLAALMEKDSSGKPIFAAFLGAPRSFDGAAVRQSEIRHILSTLNIPWLPDVAEERADDWLAEQFAKNSYTRYLFALLDRGGLFSADAFLDWLRRKLNSGEVNGQPRAFAGMTLAEFHQATGREITLVAADTTWQRMLLLNHRTAPQLPLVYAVRMSMSFPIVWEEVLWQAEWGPYHTWDPAAQGLKPNDLTGHTVVDGGLLSNFPIALFMTSQPDVDAVVGRGRAKNVLGLLIDETLPVEGYAPQPGQQPAFVSSLGGLSVVKRLHQLLDTATCAYDNTAKALFAANVVRLPAKGYSTFQFSMTDQEREALLAAGRTAMRTFLANQNVLEGVGGDVDLSVSESAEEAASALASAILAP